MIKNLHTVCSKVAVVLSDLKIQKAKTLFPRFSFQQTDVSGLVTVFHVVSFTTHLVA